MTPPASSTTIHATSVAIGGRAVLLVGASGAGKSDLALRLIDRGAALVSDDYTVLTPINGVLIANPPATIAGKIELRGVGIVALPHRSDVPVALLVRLGGVAERIPAHQIDTIAGIAVPVVALDPRAASAPIKLEFALRKATETA